MRILVVQHDDEGPAAIFGERIDAHGGECVTVLPLRGDALPESPLGFAGVLFLGGPMSVRDDSTDPHAPHLFDLARAFHEAGKPTFGICLGAQILTRALGKRVYRSEREERGFVDVSLTREGLEDRLFAGLGPTMKPLEWHEDTFDLPDGAVLLASSIVCRNQAYRIGDTTYAVQFHPEVNRGIVEAWAESSEETMDHWRREMDEHLAASEQLGRSLADRWMGILRECS